MGNLKCIGEPFRASVWNIYNWEAIHQAKIRSKDKKGGIRYIEVKERAKEGIVSLTPNEWFKAKRFKDEYFLYSVMNARTVPELYITKDPYNTLTADERKEVVRYIIPFDEIKNKGDVLK